MDADTIDPDTSATKPVVRYLKDGEGNRVAYTVHGHGPDLVLPAWWISHVDRDWDQPAFRAFLHELGQHFRVIRYDRPGVGLSDRDVAERSLESETGLLATVIETAARDFRVSLLAFSCGCPVSMTYAAENPSAIGKICVYGGYLSGRDIATPEVRAAVVALVRAHWGAGSRALADIFLPGASRQDIDALSQQQRVSTSPQTAADLLDLTYEMDATDTISRVNNEVLILHRRGDRAIPCEAGQRLAASLPGARLLTFEGRAHPPWFGDKEAVLRSAIAFLSGDTSLQDGSVEPVAADTGVHLDTANRALVIDGGRVKLTALEYGVMHYLVQHDGTVVTRDELLEHVWKTPIAGSNKVDVLMTALRKKMGAHADRVETVAGHGYRLRGEPLKRL